MLRRCAPASSKLRDPMDNLFIGDLLLPIIAENIYNWKEYDHFSVHFARTPDLNQKPKQTIM